jgi:ribosomal protein S18 acetylase RimI-like enzyme
MLKKNPNALRLYRRVGFEVVGETETRFLMRRPPTETAASDPGTGSAR